MNLREAAQQALEALEFSTLDAFMLAPISPGRESTIKAITALRAALAEPEPEHEIIARMRRLRAEAQAEHRRALEQGKCWSCMQPLPEELKTEYQVNRDLRDAAMQKLTDVQQEMEAGCDHCNSPLWCGTKCKSCGKVWDWGDKE